MVKIDYSTVSKIFKGEEASCYDELINNFARTLFEFFKLQKFGDVYVLQNCAKVITDLKLKFDSNRGFSKHSVARIKQFNALGIYFEGINNPKEYVEPTINYVVLDNMYTENLCNNYDSLKGTLKSTLAQDKKMGVGIDFSRECACCIVDNNLRNKNLYNCNKIVEEIERTFKQVIFLNRDLHIIQESGINSTKNIDINFYKRSLRRCKFLNLYKPIYENCIKNTNSIDNAVGARRLLYDLLRKKSQCNKQGYNLVFYYKIDHNVKLNAVKDIETVISNMDHIYASFYSLLTTKYRCSCVKTANNGDDIASSTSWLLAQDNMYAKDYLEMLDKFPDVTTYYSDEMGYYCVIDYDKLKRVDPDFKRDYKYEVTIINVKYDPATKHWKMLKK